MSPVQPWVPPVNKLRVVTSLEETKMKLSHNVPLKFGTAARVFVGGMREQMMITIGLMCIETPSHYVILRRV